MRELKRLIDPHGLLNPGVILNDDPRAHVLDLKDLPDVEEEVDQCIECGFCERMCPSRDLTLTPRQRIVVRREIARLRAAGSGSGALAELEADYGYDALETCAADGMCALACPVGIDTGQLVKRLRSESHSPLSEELALRIGERLAWIEKTARAGLSVARLWSSRYPRPSRGELPPTARSGARALYWPSCVSRVVGPAEQGEPSIVELLTRVAARAGVPVWVPEDIPGSCCGMPFSSKGYRQAYRFALNRTLAKLWDWSAEGQLPIVVDASPCAYTLKTAREDLQPAQRDRFDALEILDSIEFAARLLQDGLTPKRRLDSVVLHPVCSVHKMELVDTLETVAHACAFRVLVPIAAGCCGFAGDRGFSLPELTAAATRAEADEVLSDTHDGYYSSSRTCEIGLSRATGKPYRSLWSMLDEATR